MSYFQLQVICYCQYESINGKNSGLVCVNDGTTVTSMNCEEGNVCVGATNLTNGIPISKARKMYENGAFCVKG